MRGRHLVTQPGLLFSLTNDIAYKSKRKFIRLRKEYCERGESSGLQDAD